jgi:hypothetical protein
MENLFLEKLSSNSVGTLSLIDEENIDPVTRTGNNEWSVLYILN